MCARGFDVATGRTSSYWAGDLMHRIYHTIPVGEGIVDHHADGYHGCVELAAGENYTLAASNSATLSYFATEVYAFDISIPGEGCLGKPDNEDDGGHGSVPASSSVTESGSSTAIETSTAAALEATTTTINPTRIIQTTSATSSAAATQETTAGGKECHFHSDGTEHCV
jgi:hypothetical protein